MTQAPPKRIVVLGSTGSVGTQALDVVRAQPGRFRVVGLSGRSNWQLLAQQAREFSPEAAAVADAETAAALSTELNGHGICVLHGVDTLARLAAWDGVDMVVSAVSGGAGLPAAVAALRAGRILALANKEAIVMCGPRLVRMAREAGHPILPVDSEHSAIFQLLSGVKREEVVRVTLTASGGPFRGLSREELDRVTPEQALKHPTWSMGSKITIDSATLMNKALEIIEASYLFDLPPEKIGVLVHPQSIIHCMVELVDGAVLAHMGVPDMRLPIQYAMGYPDRLPSPVSRLDLTKLSGLEFSEPDQDAFPALGLGYRVARTRGTSGAALSAANEVAVAAFLNGRIRFTDIARVVEQVLDRHEVEQNATFEAAIAADEWAREEAERCLTA